MISDNDVNSLSIGTVTLITVIIFPSSDGHKVKGCLFSAPTRGALKTHENGLKSHASYLAAVTSTRPIKDEEGYNHRFRQLVTYTFILLYIYKY